MCKRPGKIASDMIRCSKERKLKIRWPTDLVFGADVTKVPDTINSKLQQKILNVVGLFFDIVIIGKIPP